MKNENYITVQGWMVNDLGLKGNELLAYAMVYGFCQDGETEFNGSIKYFCNFLSCSRPTAIKTLANLVEKGLLQKRHEEIKGVVFCRYKTFTGGKETLRGGSKETLPNNTNIDTTNDNTNYIKEDDFSKNGFDNNENFVFDAEKKERKKVAQKKESVDIPFGLKFKECWFLWKSYKKVQFNFRYKSHISEQAAINKVVELSEGMEETAIEIIKQSMGNGWQGLFKIKENGNGNNKNNGKGLDRLKMLSQQVMGAIEAENL